jgi:hypothetical protein
MNDLLYNARMALRDIIEINITTKGSHQVYLSVSPGITWASDGPETDEQRAEREHAGRVHTENAVRSAVELLRDMDMVLVGGDNAISALLEYESVEILRKAG